MRERLRQRQEQQLVTFLMRYNNTNVNRNHLTHASSAISLSQAQGISNFDSKNYLISPRYYQTHVQHAPNLTSDSPRSLDHYYGFGSNYHQIFGHLNQPSSLSGSPAFTERHEVMSLSPNWPCSSPSYMYKTTNPNPPNLKPSEASVRSAEPPSSGHSHRAQVIPTVSQPVAPLDQSILSGPMQNFASQAPTSQTHPHPPPQRRGVTIDSSAPTVLNEDELIAAANRRNRRAHSRSGSLSRRSRQESSSPCEESGEEGRKSEFSDSIETTGGQQSGDQDRWSDSEADAIVRVAKETAQMALSMYQFTKGEGDLNTTQDLFTQAELFAEEANELYKEARCFSYKVSMGELTVSLWSLDA